MKTVYMGLDASKGYVDVAVIKELGSILSKKGTFDNTHEVHHEVHNGILEHCKSRTAYL